AWCWAPIALATIKQTATGMAETLDAILSIFLQLHFQNTKLEHSPDCVKADKPLAAYRRRLCCLSERQPMGVVPNIAQLAVTHFAQVTQIQAPSRFAAIRAREAPKRDGCHGYPCLVLTIYSRKKGTAMKNVSVILALAFVLTAGMALTTAF